MWILSFTPLRLYLGKVSPFTVFLLETTVLRFTCFQVFLSLLQFFLGHSQNQMVYDMGTLSPYLWSKTTKNNMSFLNQDILGRVQLASMYSLYGIEMPPSPQDITYPLSNSSVEGSSILYLYGITQWGQRFGTQCPPVPSSPTPIPWWQSNWYGQVAIPRLQGCDTQILPPVCWYILTSLASLHLFAHFREKVGGIHYLPLVYIKGVFGH